MSHARTLHTQWCEERALEGEPYDPDKVIFCGTETCEREATVLIENRVGLAPLCLACLNAFEFGAYGIKHPKYREIGRELLQGGSPHETA